MLASYEISTCISPLEFQQAICSLVKNMTLVLFLIHLQQLTNIRLRKVIMLYIIVILGVIYVIKGVLLFFKIGIPYSIKVTVKNDENLLNWSRNSSYLNLLRGLIFVVFVVFTLIQLGNVMLWLAILILSLLFSVYFSVRNDRKYLKQNYFYFRLSILNVSAILNEVNELT